MRSVHGLLFVSLSLVAACGDTRTPPGEASAQASTAPTAHASAAPSISAASVPAPPADPDPPPPPAAPPPTSLPLSEAQLAAFFANGSQKVSAPVFETVLLRLATCKIEPGWVNDCPAYQDLMKVVGRYKGGDGFPAEPALRHLRHPSYAVRGSAVSFAGPYVFGGEPDAAKEQLYLDAMRSETDADVLESLLRYGAPGAARNPAIRRFVVRAASHPDARVKKAAEAILAGPDVTKAP